MNNSLACWAVIPAAGRSQRFSSDTPKQYWTILSRLVVEHALQPFIDHPMVRGIVVAISAHDAVWSRIKLPTTKIIVTAVGGEQRSDSVYSALQQLPSSASELDFVLVHDAARPCLSRKDLDQLISSLSAHECGGLLATPVRDTIKQVDDKLAVQRTLDRTMLWQALTPQMFRLKLLKEALSFCKENGITVTDEASAMEAIGYHPKIVEGRWDNIKITYPEDLTLATGILQRLQNLN